MGEASKKSTYELAGAPNETIPVRAGEIIAIDAKTKIGTLAEVGGPHRVPVARLARIKLDSGASAEIIRDRDEDGAETFYLAPLIEVPDAQGESVSYRIDLSEEHKHKIEGSLRLGRSKSEKRDDGSLVEIDVDLNDMGFVDTVEEDGIADSVAVSREQLQIDIVDGNITITNLATPNAEDPDTGMFRVERVATPEEDAEITLPKPITLLVSPPAPLPEAVVEAQLADLEQEAKTAVAEALDEIEPSPVDAGEPLPDETTSAARRLIERDMNDLQTGNTKTYEIPIDRSAAGVEDGGAPVEVSEEPPINPKPKAPTKKEIAQREKEAREAREVDHKAYLTVIDSLAESMGGDHESARAEMLEAARRIQYLEEGCRNALDSHNGVRSNGLRQSIHTLEVAVKELGQLYSVSEPDNVAQILKKTGELVQSAHTSWHIGEEELSGVIKYDTQVYGVALTDRIEGLASTLHSQERAISLDDRRQPSVRRLSNQMAEAAHHMFEDIIPGTRAIEPTIQSIDFAARVNRIGDILSSPGRRGGEDVHHLIVLINALRDDAQSAINSTDKVKIGCVEAAERLTIIANWLGDRGGDVRDQAK